MRRFLLTKLFSLVIQGFTIFTPFYNNSHRIFSIYQVHHPHFKVLFYFHLFSTNFNDFFKEIIFFLSTYKQSQIHIHPSNFSDPSVSNVFDQNVKSLLWNSTPILSEIKDLVKKHLVEFVYFGSKYEISSNNFTVQY